MNSMSSKIPPTWLREAPILGLSPSKCWEKSWQRWSLEKPASPTQWQGPICSVAHCSAATHFKLSGTYSPDKADNWLSQKLSDVNKGLPVLPHYQGTRISELEKALRDHSDRWSGSSFDVINWSVTVYVWRNWKFLLRLNTPMIQQFKS